MDNSTPVLVWVVAVSGLTVFGLIALFLGVLFWHQRRLAAEATRWGYQLLEAIDGERHRIASELHDDMIPRLITVRWTEERAGAEPNVQVLEGVITGLRGLAHALHPPALRHLDLGNALSDLADDIRRDRPSTEVAVEVSNGLAVLGEDVSLALYRIAQEATMNALKHADPKQVVISLQSMDTDMVLTVEDNGSGVKDASRLGLGFGTRSMRERARRLGGRLDFSSEVGRGTTVTCRVPR